MKKKIIPTGMKWFMFILLILGIGCYIGAGITLYNSNYKLSNYYEDLRNDYWVNDMFGNPVRDVISETIEDKEITNITINTNFTKVEVIKNIDAKTQISIAGRFDVNDEVFKSMIRMSKNNGEVSISLNNEERLKYGVLKIYVPIEYKGNISVNTSSGNIRINDMSLDTIKVESNSGDVKLDNITVNNLEVKCNSASISSDNIYSLKSNIKTISGEVDLVGYLGDSNILTTSGEIDLDLRKINKETNITTSSGEVSVDMATVENYKIVISTSSGNIEKDSNIKSEKTSNGMILRKGSEDNIINIKTSSGNCDIN